MSRAHTRTVVAGILVAVLVVAAVAALATLPVPNLPETGDGENHGTLSERWISDTERDISGNHHVPVAGRVDGTGMVYAPVSGAAHRHENGSVGAHRHDGVGDCALVALYGANGTARWADRVPAANCTIHSVSDPTLTDLDVDGRPVVVAATTERVVRAFDPASGEVLFTRELSSYGYTRPIAADVAGDEALELVVVDVRGSVFVVGRDSGTLWQRRHDSFTWGQPTVADFDADGQPELFVALGNGTTVMYGAADGHVEWQRALESDDAITWATTVSRTDDAGHDVLIATTEGWIRQFDGRNGSSVWELDVGDLAAVHAVGDGDEDGAVEIYAASGDGVVHGISASSGTVEWSTNVTTAGTQMMPPPSLGDLDGDGRPELVAPTNNGRVTVLSPDTGTVLATYRRDVSIWTRADLADLDGNGGQEVVVMYGDGRVTALAYDGRVTE